MKIGLVPMSAKPYHAGHHMLVEFAAISEIVEELEELEDAVLFEYVVLGEVKKPGTYEYDPSKGDMTLLKVISIAGGFSPIANQKKIRILKRGGEDTRSITVSIRDIISGKRPDEPIDDKDLISVPESLF